MVRKDFCGQLNTLLMGFSRIYIIVLGLLTAFVAKAQNAVYIPPALNGPTYNLNVQSGTTVLFPTYNTPTYGVNGVWMAPTLILNQGDSVTLNVTNSLPVTTTMHWHGLHVPAKWDGGPHQVINQAATWSPRFKVLNSAGTYWYHPHGNMQTELQVSRGIAGMIIVKDPVEAALTLPRTYGVDDFPVIVQSKAFDVLRQIAIASEDDTTVLVNGTMQPYLDAPAQVVRLRLLNGSAMRSFLFGLTGNMPFHLIGTDDGLLDSATTLTRIRVSPGERVEILVNLTGMQSQTIYLRNFGSELPDGIHGAANVGMGAALIPDYNLNPRNGADYDVMKINVIAPTATPVTTIPTTLVPLTPWPAATANTTRSFYFNPEQLVDSAQLTEGPFRINGYSFNMNVIHDTTYLNHVEIWKLVNETLIAHPFHVHDVSFYVLDINGNPPPLSERGKKDVVLVMPGDTVRFITKFEDFTDPTVPYMYHCHMLHHEDEGMMGSFLVLNFPASIPNIAGPDAMQIAPNPVAGIFTIQYPNEIKKATITSITGQTIIEAIYENGILNPKIDLTGKPLGLYVLRTIDIDGNCSVKKIIKN